MENADFDFDVLASDWRDAGEGASREMIAWYEREQEELEAEMLAYEQEQFELDREQQEVW